MFASNAEDAPRVIISRFNLFSNSLNPLLKNNQLSSWLKDPIVAAAALSNLIFLQDSQLLKNIVERALV